MNTAQKVRLWFILGVSILQAIAIIVLGTIPDYSLAVGGGDGAWAWVLITFIANVTLGSISLYRFLHPLLPKPQGYAPTHGYYPPQQPQYAPPPQPQYAQPTQQPVQPQQPTQPHSPYGSY